MDGFLEKSHERDRFGLEVRASVTASSATTSLRRFTIFRGPTQRFSHLWLFSTILLAGQRGKKKEKRKKEKKKTTVGLYPSTRAVVAFLKNNTRTRKLESETFSLFWQEEGHPTQL